MDDQGFDLVIFLDEQGGEKSHPIRRIWHEGRLYFSVIDIIAALEVSTIPPRTYWAQLKDRVKEEGFEEAVRRILQFPLKSADGRLRKTDCADTETLLRLVQSISSKRVEWIKQFLARAGNQKLDEMATQRLANLAGAAFRAKVQEYLDRGYELDWASVRTQGDMVRNDLTDTWTDRGAQGPEFGILTATMHKGAFGIPPGEHKRYKNVPAKEELRDHLTIPELGVSIFTETIGISLHQKRDSQGFEELQHDAHDAGEAGRKAREVAEEALGERVVSSENYMHLKKVRGGGKSRKALPGSLASKPTQSNLFDETSSQKE
jgi:hypothetical protein